MWYGDKQAVVCYKLWLKDTLTIEYKHSESIAEAVHVPYRPNTFQRHKTSARIDQRSWSVLCQYKLNWYINFQVNILKDGREKSRKLNFSLREVTLVKEGRTKQKARLICITSRQFHILSFKTISQKKAEISLKNWILAKGINSCKRRSNMREI